jgi:hypothetical protein
MRITSKQSVAARKWRTLVRTLLIFVALGVGQSQAPTVPRTAGVAAVKPLPQRVVYWQLFRHILFLEHQADLADQRGLDGSQLRNFYQVHANLTAAEATLMKQYAQGTTTAVQAVDVQIQAAVARFRAQFPGGKLPSHSALPPPPPELQTLQDQRDNLVLSNVAGLQSALGAGRFQNFDAYVQTSFAPHISIKLVGQPRPHDGSSRGHLPPFPPLP